MSDNIDHQTGNLISLDHFNEKAVSTFFRYLPQTELEEKAMAYMHKILGEEISNSTLDRLDLSRMISSVAIEKIQYRYEMYKHYAHLFPLSSSQEDHDALALAVICDEYTVQINEPVQSPQPEVKLWHDNDNDEEEKFRDDGFDEIIVGRACYIWEAAKDLEDCGAQEDMDDPEPEAVFLAHINALERLKELENDFGNYPDSYYQEILRKDFPNLETYLCPHTAIGGDVQNWLKAMEKRILDLFPKASPSLSIVNPDNLSP